MLVWLLPVASPRRHRVRPAAAHARRRRDIVDESVHCCAATLSQAVRRLQAGVSVLEAGAHQPEAGAGGHWYSVDWQPDLAGVSWFLYKLPGFFIVFVSSMAINTRTYTYTQTIPSDLHPFVCFIASQHTLDQLRLRQYNTLVYVGSKLPSSRFSFTAMFPSWSPRNFTFPEVAQFLTGKPGGDCHFHCVHLASAVMAVSVHPRRVLACGACVGPHGDGHGCCVLPAKWCKAKRGCF